GEMLTSELKLIEGGKEQRDKYIKRVDVLEKVKELNTLAGTEFMTTNQVAEFYEVSKIAINKIHVRFANELSEDGVKKLKAKDISTIVPLDKLSKRKVNGGLEISGEFLRYI